LIAAITGATGYVGRFIVERLIAEGVSVRAWRRPTSDLTGLPKEIEWIEGALDSPVAASALVKGADALVHAALHHVPGRFRRGEGDDLPHYVKINVGGSLALLAMAREAGVRRCVVLSSRAVFGRAGPAAPVGDDDPVSPDTNYGASKAALEVFVRVWGAEGWPIAALRPTGVYGMVVPAGKTKWFDVVSQALAGEPVEPRTSTEVHGRDVADSVWRLMQVDTAEMAGSTFNCSDIVVSTRDIVSLAHRFTGAAGPLPEAPPPPANVMRSDGLTRLGVAFGGWPLFEETIAALVDAVTKSGAVLDGREAAQL
jgi:nucleoside-diphosphate-sugar epimerase